MKTLYPDKLKQGDTVVVISPSKSLAIVADQSKKIANKRFEELGLKLVFGKHVEESDDFVSSSIESRIEDLHNAFSDTKIKAIITVIGGFNSNQLLDNIDWSLVENNPKIFCGYSDITVLSNAIFAKTGLVSYSSPHYSSFGQKLYFDYTLDYFRSCLMSNKSFDLKASGEWSDDKWYKNQDDRQLIENRGYLVINAGETEGTIAGGNLCSFNLLQGTRYMPSLKNTVLFVEDDHGSNPTTFDRDLQSLIHQPNFKDVKAVLIGRFQKASNMTNDLLVKIIKTKKPLKTIPVIANIDFGHTDPKITFPIGGKCQVSASKETTKIAIIKH